MIIVLTAGQAVESVASIRTGHTVTPKLRHGGTHDARAQEFRPTQFSSSEGPARVEDAGWVERRFDRLVHGQRRGSELLP